MFFRSLLRCTVALAIVAPLTALAGSMNVKTGAWEMTTTTLMEGMPLPPDALANMPPEQRARIEQMMQARSGKPHTSVTKSCITKDDLDQDRMIKPDDEGNCTNKVISKSANRIVMEQTCAAPRSTKGTMTIEAKSPESVVSSIDMVQGSGGGKVHVDVKGRWLGASCDGI